MSFLIPCIYLSFEKDCENGEDEFDLLLTPYKIGVGAVLAISSLLIGGFLLVKEYRKWKREYPLSMFDSERAGVHLKSTKVNVLYIISIYLQLCSSLTSLHILSNIKEYHHPGRLSPT